MTLPEIMIPCPFCGSADIDPEGVYTKTDCGTPYEYPCCNNCMASCEIWNTRTPPDSVTIKREVVEKLQEFFRRLVQERSCVLHTVQGVNMDRRTQDDVKHIEFCREHLGEAKTARALLDDALKGKT